jgi:leader peptidase (prepilin peptidase)/N-methyltransferase
LTFHLAFSVFLFALGASLGSFLNVVVWRLPRFGIGSLATPPSHCPKCQHRLAWKDNIPVFGWIFLKGKCRYCREPISIRYPVVEFVTAALFVFYYWMFFYLHVSPCAPQEQMVQDTLFNQVKYVPRLMTTIVEDWPYYALCMFLIWSLLTVSLIDAELFEIPLVLTWTMAGVGIAVHAIIDYPTRPGAVNLTDPTGILAGLAAGGGAGLLVSMFLFHKGILAESFSKGEPGLEIDEAAYQEELTRAKSEHREAPVRPPTYTTAEIRGEIYKEILFLMPPLLGSLVWVIVTQKVPALREAWRGALQYHWVTGLLGAVLGALVGGLVVWLARILGTLAFGRVAMGLGDVHLMFGVGALVGAGPAVVAFFVAPFMGILVGLWMLISRKRHELPYGPYLSLATAVVVLFYCPIAEYLRPGIQGLGQVFRSVFGAA